jgi:hypothetical protein
MRRVRFSAALGAAVLAGTAVAEAQTTVTIATVNHGDMLISGPSSGAREGLRTRLLTRRPPGRASQSPCGVERGVACFTEAEHIRAQPEGRWRGARDGAHE